MALIHLLGSTVGVVVGYAGELASAGAAVNATNAAKPSSLQVMLPAAILTVVLVVSICSRRTSAVILLGFVLCLLSYLASVETSVG
jgi:hypothetical protein